MFKNYKMMHLEISCPVDSGTIAVLPEQEIKHIERRYEDDYLVNIITLGKGKYEIFGVVKAWNIQYFGGEITLDKKQKVFIGDPCYLFTHTKRGNKEWDDFLRAVYPNWGKDRDYEIREGLNFIVADKFGGDGNHPADLWIRKIGRQ